MCVRMTCSRVMCVEDNVCVRMMCVVGRCVCEGDVCVCEGDVCTCIYLFLHCCIVRTCMFLGVLFMFFIVKKT